MKPEEQEARTQAVRKLAKHIKRLSADSSTLISIIVRLSEGEPTARVLGSMRKIQTGGRDFGPETEEILQLLETHVPVTRETWLGRRAEREAEHERHRQAAMELEARKDAVKKSRPDWWNDPVFNGDYDARQERERQASEAAWNAAVAKANGHKPKPRQTEEGNVVFLQRPDIGAGERP